jgi:hypothetical protein
MEIRGTATTHWLSEARALRLRHLALAVARIFKAAIAPLVPMRCSAIAVDGICPDARLADSASCATKADTPAIGLIGNLGGDWPVSVSVMHHCGSAFDSVDCNRATLRN